MQISAVQQYHTLDKKPLNDVGGDVMSVREDVINLIAEKCENKFDYYDIVNERTETIDYSLIAEFILEFVLSIFIDDEGIKDRK